MISGTIVLEGEVALSAPALIGSGQSERSDMDLLLDHDGKPFIPATSFVGVLRHLINNKDEENNIKRFWGFAATDKISEDEKERGSALRCRDLVCLDENPQTRTRDGIKINNKTGIVEEHMKYDYEVIESGTRFKLSLEIPYHVRNNDSNQTDAKLKYLEKSFLQQMLLTVTELLRDGKVSLGAKTNNGLGKLRLVQHHFYDYDFSNKDHVLKWLRANGHPESVFFNGSPLEITTDEFRMDAWFNLRNSLIIRSYPTEPDAPDTDAVHIQSSGEYVIPGSSWKGAIRARAERILRTLSQTGEKWPEDIFTTLFGEVDEKHPDKRPRRGKISVEETVLPKFVAELQTRIKIDRFTGGTIEGALFDSMPLFNHFRESGVIDFTEKAVHLTITVRKWQEHEVGLLLLILKDLWTGDLAIGGEKNVGRGVFDGIQAEIRFGNQEPIILPKNIADLDEAQKEMLEKYVTALVKKVEEAN